MPLYAAIRFSKVRKKLYVISVKPLAEVFWAVLVQWPARRNVSESYVPLRAFVA